MKQEHVTCDVAIIGGGLAGLTLACLLAQQESLQIVVVDAADPQKPMIGDERTTAISYGSQQILKQAGIWKNLEKRGAEIRDIQILDGQSSVLLNFLSSEVEDKEFGTILENSLIREALQKKIKSYKNIQFLAPAKVTDFSQHSDYVDILLDEEKTARAKLAIGADGRKSFMRQWLDIDCRKRDYKQTAIVCMTRHENPHHNVAVEHFWPEGPFAILPMSNDADGSHRSSIVFTEHCKRQDSMMHFDRKAFELALQARFPESYGAVEMIGERSAYPLSLVHASRYIDNRMVLIADAAHGIHPIAGQGLNLGFRDVKELANLITSAYTKGADIGSKDVLETYQRRRRPDNMAMVAVTDGLVKLFSNNITPIRIVRKIGLKAVGRIPMAKRFFMKQAMADRG